MASFMKHLCFYFHFYLIIDTFIYLFNVVFIYFLFNLIGTFSRPYVLSGGVANKLWKYISETVKIS